MAVAALVKFVQGATIGAPGQALIGVAGTAVQVTNGAGAPGPITTWTFAVIAVPSGSAVPLGVAQSGPLQTWSFTPDIAGCYIIELLVQDAFGNTANDVRAFGIKTPSGRLIPSFTGDASSLNFGGQTQGWDPYLESWLNALEQLIEESGSMSLPVYTATVSYVCDSRVTPDEVVIVNFSAPGSVTMPVPTKGRPVTVRVRSANPGTNTCAILPHGAESVDGYAGGIIVSTAGGLQFVADESGNWISIGVR
jgi:hypothetical protein